MSRLKIVLTTRREEHSSFLGDVSQFHRQLDERLRYSSMGLEWVVHGPTAGADPSQPPQSKIEHQLLCQIDDVEHRLPLISKLLRAYELEDRCVIYEEHSRGPRWERIWPDQTET
jgi:hypothetical protein